MCVGDLPTAWFAIFTSAGGQPTLLCLSISLGILKVLKGLTFKVALKDHNRSIILGFGTSHVPDTSLFSRN